MSRPCAFFSRFASQMPDLISRNRYPGAWHRRQKYLDNAEPLIRVFEQHSVTVLPLAQLFFGAVLRFGEIEDRVRESRGSRKGGSRCTG